MFKKMLLSIMLGFSLVAGGFWALKAQDPAPQKPSPAKPEPQVTPAQTETRKQTVQTDLSGTYAGTFNCESMGLTGDTTLTVNGNEFTLSDGRTGRIVASTTRGYTSVALQLKSTDPATTGKVTSFRARKKGNKLTLTGVGSPEMKCSFVPSRNMAKGTPAATGTDVANPSATPMASQTPSPSPTATPEPSPEPNPSPTPSRSPRPRPTPSGTPAPSPSPSEPTPTPSPSPSPRP